MLNVLLMGACVLAAFFVMRRIRGKGRVRSYEDSRKHFAQRLQKTAAQTRERSLSAGVAEQMLPIAAAVRELCELAGTPPGRVLLEEGRTVRVWSPAGEIRIDFGLPGMRTAERPGRPRGCWRIRGPGAERKDCEELAEVVAYLRRVLLF